MLIDIYKDIFENKESLWKYYSRLQLNYPFDKEDTAECFIKSYLQYANKNDLFLETGLESLRKLHTVSVFFLGIHLLEKLQEFYNYDITKFVKSFKTNKSIKSSFSFFWFLTCLYHDIGYIFETCEVKDPKYLTFKSLKKTLLHKLILNKDHSIPKKLLQSIKNYYNNHHQYDHGIIGGYKLYDSILNLYEYIRHDYTMPDRNDLVLDESFKPVFASIAKTIAVHNLWFCFEEIETEEKCNQYVNQGIKDLIIRNGTNNPISFVNHPLLYILCLADTIDPVKTILKYVEQNHLDVNLADILSKIQLEFVSKDQIFLSTEDPDFRKALLKKFAKENAVPTNEQKINKKWLGVDIRVKDLE